MVSILILSILPCNVKTTKPVDDIYHYTISGDVINPIEKKESKKHKIKSILCESIEQYKHKKIKQQKKKQLLKKKKNKQINEYNKYQLAKLIYCEVGSMKQDEVLYLCGSVVLNRIKDSRYPNTMDGVIFQKGQWEVTWNGAWNYKKPDKRCLRIASDLLKNGPIAPVNGMAERYWGKPYKQFDNVKFSIV